MQLTRKGAETRQRIVAGAADEVRDRGVTALTLQDVLARTRTSKGQLFHYFPGGKDELLLAVAQHESDQQPSAEDLTTWAAWHDWRDRVVAHYRGTGERCTLSDLAAQPARTAPGAQAVITRLLATRQAHLTAGIRHLQATGEIDAELDAERAATALVAGIQGGVAVLMATGSTAHLEAALDIGIAGLRPRFTPARGR
ncbi:TetR/AcrR family transcriptional regulator [Actinoplanes palleronii]|uniref:TetR family transcriptional regulator n=1 Tax=Actinoplanes palleronii TaxID=113570 RepID=A0ABQ4BKK1_9ACTN|nr:TetR/AcrR family transcriptional regulator [Actinoplanes palleronii]GIE71214.1 TetR family transcriptional regulator [Actinoplanes palleronii]